jgi:hypothetical protein
MMAHPDLDSFFDSWAPSVACMRDRGYPTFITGANFDRARRHYGLILQVRN